MAQEKVATSKTSLIAVGLFSIALSLAMLAVLGYGAWWVLTTLFSADVEIVAAVITALTAIVGTVLASRFAAKRERQLDIAQRVREKKAEAYASAIDMIFEIIVRQRYEGSLKDAVELPRDLMEKIYQVTRMLTLWASDDVLKAWSTLRLKSLRDDVHPIELAWDIDRLADLMRQDGGHPDTKLPRGTISAAFLTDAGTTFPQLTEELHGGVISYEPQLNMAEIEAAIEAGE